VAFIDTWQHILANEIFSLDPKRKLKEYLNRGLKSIWQLLQNSQNYYLINLKELSPSWKATSCAATQEFFKILSNPKVHYCVYKSPPLVPIQNQIDPVHATPSYHCKINFSILRPPTSWSSKWYLSCLFSHQYPICIHFLPHSCYIPCSFHTPWLDHCN
jgi:hypothetical protein